MEEISNHNAKIINLEVPGFNSYNVLPLRLPSAVMELYDPLFEAKKVRVYVKRDDLIHPLVSGNKWRKLKYTLQEAALLDRTHIVTFGGAWSNHLLATAAATYQTPFECTAFVRGEAVDNSILSKCKRLGMNVFFVDRGSYREKENLFAQHFGANEKAYFLAEGGSGGPAIKGCAELVDELDETYDHIFCAAGTGATAAGIAEGIAARKMHTTVHAVSVLKGNFMAAEIAKFTNEAVEVHNEFHFGGYAKLQPELLNFVNDFSWSTGVTIEPVYTGKMFYALYSLIRDGRFEAGNKILAVHTGGVYKE